MKIVIIITVIIGFVVGVYFLLQLSPLFLEQLIVRPVSPLLATPRFSLPSVEGNLVTPSDFLGKIVIINFWTSWNEPSVALLKLLNSYQQRNGDKNILVIAVNSLETKTVVKRIQDRERLTLPILLDEDGTVGELYRIGVLPLTVILSKEGSIIKQIIGPLSQDEINEMINQAQSL